MARQAPDYEQYELQSSPHAFTAAQSSFTTNAGRIANQVGNQIISGNFINGNLHNLTSASSDLLRGLPFSADAIFNTNFTRTDPENPQNVDHDALEAILRWAAAKEVPWPSDEDQMQYEDFDSPAGGDSIGSKDHSPGTANKCEVQPRLSTIGCKDNSDAESQDKENVDESHESSLISEDEEDSRGRILWLCGKKYSGKSAILHSTVTALSKQQCSVVSFFFPRRSTKISYFVTTVAHQLAAVSPNLRQHILDTVERDHHIQHRDIAYQWEHLVVQPIRAWASASKEELKPIILVVDGFANFMGPERHILLQLWLDIDAQRAPFPLRLVFSSRPNSLQRGRARQYTQYRYTLVADKSVEEKVKQDARGNFIASMISGFLGVTIVLGAAILGFTLIAVFLFIVMRFIGAVLHFLHLI